MCSPLAARARDRRASSAARIGLAPEEDARFTETDTGDWTDRTFAEIQRRGPRGLPPLRARPTRPSATPAASRSPSSPTACRTGLARPPRRAADLPALVVCHRGSIRLALAVATGDHDGRRPRDRQRDAGDRVSRRHRLRLRRARRSRRSAAFFVAQRLKATPVGRRRVPPHAVLLAQPRRPLRPRDGALRDPQARPTCRVAVVDADGDEVRDAHRRRHASCPTARSARAGTAATTTAPRARRRLPLPHHAAPTRAATSCIPESVRARHDAAHAARDLDRPGEGHRAAAGAAAGARRRRGGRPLHRPAARARGRRSCCSRPAPGPVQQVGRADPAGRRRDAVALGRARPRPGGRSRPARTSSRSRPATRRATSARRRRWTAAGCPRSPTARRCPGAAGSPCATSACSRRAAPVAVGKPVGVRRRPARRALDVHGAPRRLERGRRAAAAHTRGGVFRVTAPGGESGVYLFDVRTRAPAHVTVALRRAGRREAPGARRPADDDLAGAQPGRRRRRRRCRTCSTAACRCARPRARRRRPPGGVRPARGAAARVAGPHRAALRRHDRRRARRRARARSSPGTAACCCPATSRWLPARPAVAAADVRPRRRDARLARPGLAAPPGAVDPARAPDRPDAAGARPTCSAARLGAVHAPDRPGHPHRGGRSHRPVRGHRRPVPGLARARAARGAPATRVGCSPRAVTEAGRAPIIVDALRQGPGHALRPARASRRSSARDETDSTTALMARTWTLLSR